jgi:hypothetical protein
MIPPNCIRQYLEVEQLESTIDAAVNKCVGRYWDENGITTEILRDILGAVPKWKSVPRFRTGIAFDAFKQIGKNEKNFGDIAFIVKITFPNGNAAEGVAFLEAKRIYKSKSFSEIKDWSKLKHMSANSQHHFLLLYDDIAQPVPIMGLGGCLSEPCIYCPGVMTRATVVKTPHAIAYGVKSRKLHTIGNRLSEQIYFRFFRGLDLEFNSERVRSLIAGDGVGVKFLIVANIVLGNEKIKPSIEEISQQISTRYTRIAESGAGES